MRTAVAPSQRRLLSGAAVTDVAAAAAAQTPSRLLVSSHRPAATSCSTAAMPFSFFGSAQPHMFGPRRLRGMRQKEKKVHAQVQRKYIYAK